jgi:5-hydroxyisourate hydrolase-like protein (transthyretin family)
MRRVSSRCAKPATLAALVLLALTAVVAAQAPTPQAPPVPTAAISGVVIDATTSRPIAGATVSLSRINSDNSMAAPGSLPRTLTDARGRFVFRNLPASTGYLISSRRFGYSGAYFGWTGPNGPNTLKDLRHIAVAEGQWVNNITVLLWRLGSVSGHVLDERGEPVIGVAVRLYTQRRLAGVVRWIDGAIATTDDRGAYRIVDLDPGQYVVGVPSVQSTLLTSVKDGTLIRAIGELETGGYGVSRGNGLEVPTIDADSGHRLAVTNFAMPPPPSAGVARAYPPTFYPASRALGTAQPLTIDYGTEQTGIDVRLEPVRALRVSGTLVPPPGLAPPTFLLRLMAVGSETLGFGSESATTMVETGGAFTFLNVPEGQYTLIAQSSTTAMNTGNGPARLPMPPGLRAESLSVGAIPGGSMGALSVSGNPEATWGRASISVGDANIDHLQIPLQSTAKITVRLVFADGVTPPSVDRPMLLSAEPANGDPSLGSASAFSPPGDAARTFAFEGLLGGRYLLRPPNAFNLISVVVDGKDVADTGIDASAGDITDVLVTLTDKKASITGTVHDAAGPTAAALIVFPTDPARWTNYGWRPTKILTSSAGTNGAFRFDRVLEGDYFIVAVDGTHQNDWTDPKFLDGAAAVASRVTIKWGETKTVDLAIAKVQVAK